MSEARILVGDVREVLPTLADASVQCVVTSPPYWGLRDYGHEKQIGSERTYPEYIATMVEVFREVRRILRDDGVLWLNLGDCYATGAGAVGERPGGGEQGARWAGTGGTRGANLLDVNGRGERRREIRDGRHAGKHTAMAAMGPMTQPNRLPQPGLKPKDLVGIPWRVAFALQADGWWLRSENIWHKPNPMPSSVKDRTTMAHEQVFMLSKSERYFYDAAAIAEVAVSAPKKANDMRRGTSAMRGQASIRARGKNEASPDRRRAGFNERWDNAEAQGTAPKRRNKRSVWTIAPASFAGAHFAVMPEALAELCVLAGSRQGDVVLDPFGGAGTVAVVAVRSGRVPLLVELNPSYAAIARERIENDAPLLSRAEAGA